MGGAGLFLLRHAWLAGEPNTALVLLQRGERRAKLSIVIGHEVICIPCTTRDEMPHSVDSSAHESRPGSEVHATVSVLSSGRQLNGCDIFRVGLSLIIVSNHVRGTCFLSPTSHRAGAGAGTTHSITIAASPVMAPAPDVALGGIQKSPPALRVSADLDSIGLIQE